MVNTISKTFEDGEKDMGEGGSATALNSTINDRMFTRYAMMRKMPRIHRAAEALQRPGLHNLSNSRKGDRSDTIENSGAILPLPLSAVDA